jgi:flagellin
MASYINTNLSSQQAQRSLSTSQASLSSSIQRLSSGLRVNGAKDDAAGLAIATGMDKTMRGQTVAMRNANDAISFSQTTEGALGKVSDTLQRMRELAVQSANGTNSADQRGAMNTEFKQLQDEIGRVTKNTEFNGLQVLGKDSKQTFQIGSGTTDDNQIAINGTDLTATTSATNNTIATAGMNFASAFDVAKAAEDSGGAFATDKDVSTGTDGNGNKFLQIGTGTNKEFMRATQDANGAVTITKATGAGATPTDVEMAAGATVTESAFKTQLATNTNATNLTTTTTAGQATLDAAQTAFNKADNVGINITNALTAKDAMDKIDASIKEINTAQTTQGAAQNRMSSVISTLQVSNENQSAARSRIMDTDFASETANLARNQILQQASTAMLGQANQLPNGVMRLLG